MPTIRTADEFDARPLAELAKTTFRDAFEAMNTPENIRLHFEANYSEALQTREILDPEMGTLVCGHDGRLIGFTQIRWDSRAACIDAERPAEIQRLYVAKEWHGKGVAQDLMANAIGLAGAKGADQVWLGVWKQNPRAIAFYKKFGFVAVGEQIFSVGNDPQRDLVMARPVQPK